MLVVDASVVLAWAFKDEGGAYAPAVLRAVGAESAIAPAIWPLEVANALLVGERRKRLTQADTTQFLSLLRALPIAVDEEGIDRAFGEVLSIARGRTLSVYDASYLELALRTGSALATTDDRLQRAAGYVGIVVWDAGRRP